MKAINWGLVSISVVHTKVSFHILSYQEHRKCLISDCGSDRHM